MTERYVQLARTCHNFNEPATDLLWRTSNGIESLSPLLSCLGDVYDYSTVQSLTIVRPLNDEDWNIIKRYTRKTRSLDLSALGFPVFERDPKAVQFLANAPSPDFLFPNLQMLWIDLEESVGAFDQQPAGAVMAFARLLSSRYISHLRLNFLGLPPRGLK